MLAIGSQLCLLTFQQTFHVNMAFGFLYLWDNQPLIKDVQDLKTTFKITLLELKQTWKRKLLKTKEFQITFNFFTIIETTFKN